MIKVKATLYPATFGVINIQQPQIISNYFFYKKVSKPFQTFFSVHNLSEKIGRPILSETAAVFVVSSVTNFLIKNWQAYIIKEI